MMACGMRTPIGAPMWRDRVSGLHARAPKSCPVLRCPHPMMSAGGGIRQPIMSTTAAATPSPGGQPMQKPTLRPPPPRNRPSHSSNTTGAGQRGGSLPVAQAPLPPPIPVSTPTTVSALRIVRKDLSRCSKQAKQHGQFRPEAQAELAALCHATTAGLQHCGSQLSALDFSFLGSSLWQASGARGSHQASIAPLAAATISAAMQAPAMTTASIDNWSGLLYGLAKAGMHTQPLRPSLYDLMSHAQHLIAAETWVAGASEKRSPLNLANIVWAYAAARYKRDVSALLSGVSSSMAAGSFKTANEQQCGNMMWALAKLGCTVQQPSTRAAVGRVLEAAQQGGMRDAIPQAWANLLWGLAAMGYSAAPGSQPDISPLVASVVSYEQQGGMQQATPQEWANVLWALATMGYSAAPGSQPDIRPLVARTVSYAQQGGMRQANAQDWGNLLWALAKSQADKATVQPVLALGLPAFRSMVDSGQCNAEDMLQVAYTLVHYGMGAEKDALLARLPRALLAQYYSEVRNPALKHLLRPISS